MPIPFTQTDNAETLRFLSGWDTDTPAPGPYTITGSRWVYDAEEVDAIFGTKHGLSGEHCFQVDDSENVAMFIPADELDGHSAGEAIQALRALNGYAPLREAVKQLVAFARAQDARMSGTEATNWSDATPPDGDDWNDLFAQVEALAIACGEG